MGNLDETTEVAEVEGKRGSLVTSLTRLLMGEITPRTYCTFSLPQLTFSLRDHTTPGTGVTGERRRQLRKNTGEMFF